MTSQRALCWHLAQPGNCNLRRPDRIPSWTHRTHGLGSAGAFGAGPGGSTPSRYQCTPELPTLDPKHAGDVRDHTGDMRGHIGDHEGHTGDVRGHIGDHEGPHR